MKFLSALGAILASIFFIFKSGKKQGKVEATQKVNTETLKDLKEIKKRKTKSMSMGEKELRAKMSKYVRK